MTEYLLIRPSLPTFHPIAQSCTAMQGSVVWYWHDMAVQGIEWGQCTRSVTEAVSLCCVQPASTRQTLSSARSTAVAPLCGWEALHHPSTRTTCTW